MNIPLELWSRRNNQPPPKVYQLCKCTNCEEKTWEDHVFNDDLDDEVSVYGNLHLERVHSYTNNRNAFMHIRISPRVFEDLNENDSYDDDDDDDDFPGQTSSYFSESPF
ncbi:unnamed protein product, partial [Adineta ricciae]